MNVKQCSGDQLDELKRAYVCDMVGSPSWGELAEASNLPDDLIWRYYEGVEFVEDDFWCSVAQ